MKKFCKLNIDLDPKLLEQDYQKIREDDWEEIASIFQITKTMFGLNLLVPDFEKIVPGEKMVLKSSNVLQRCTYLQSVIEQFSSCEILRARLNLIKPSGGIPPHTDPYWYETGQVRLHIPIVTNPDFVFIIDGESFHFPVGGCWYVNTFLEHSVENNGTTDRVHLVIDCLVNDWLEGLFVEQGFPPQAVES